MRRVFAVAPSLGAAILSSDMKKFVLSIFLVSLSTAYAGDKLLKPEEAFKNSVKLVKPGLYEINISIADGYQLYKEKFKVLEGEIESQKLSLLLPDSETYERFDQAMAKNIKYYKGSLRMNVSVPEGFTSKADLLVQAQGCEATKGVCYPPFTINLSKATSSSGSFLDFIASKFSQN